MHREIEILQNTDDIADIIAAELKSLIDDKERETIHIALSGGNTPKKIFEFLQKTYGKLFADDRLHFWWGDDRCVEPTNDDSNYKWANQLWLSPIGIKAANIHRIQGENSPRKEATRYADEIRKHLPFENDKPRFDLVILGLGEDGHTASIFPHQMDFLVSDRICELAIHPTSGQNRITFTGKVINNAEVVIFLATGGSKEKIIDKILNENDSSYPAAHIKPFHGRLLWLLDEASAELLHN